MKNNFTIIMDEEVSFGRRVALSVILNRPRRLLQLLIPGMFIFDFLRKMAETRRYMTYFLPPRKMVLVAAKNVGSNEEKDSALSKVKTELDLWLKSRNLYSEAVSSIFNRINSLLIDHYCILIGTKGDTFKDLLKNTYNTARQYESFLDRLMDLENETYTAISEIPEINPTLVQQFIELKDQAQALRKRDIDHMFYG